VRAIVQPHADDLARPPDGSEELDVRTTLRGTPSRLAERQHERGNHQEHRHKDERKRDLDEAGIRAGNLVELPHLTDCSPRTPIASGENYYMRYGCREALETGAVDIIAPDLQKTGGLLEGRRIADLAETHYIVMAPHCISSPIGTVASVHVAAAVPNFLALEWHGASVPFWDDLLVDRGGPLIEQGYIRVPTGPGLGVELNEAVARRYAKANEPFF